MDDIHLIRDVLDDQLLDRRKRKLGKADGIVVILREGKPPRVAYIEVGMSTLAHRIHPRLGRWFERLGKKWGVRHGKPYRIPWSKVKDIGIDTIVALEADETPLLDWEKWLNKRFIGRIPGGSN